MKRRLIAWVMAAATAATVAAYWVMTTSGRKFDGPYRYSGECIEAANAYRAKGYDVAPGCRFL